MLACFYNSYVNDSPPPAVIIYFNNMIIRSAYEQEMFFPLDFLLAGKRRHLIYSLAIICEKFSYRG